MGIIDKIKIFFTTASLVEKVVVLSIVILFLVYLPYGSMTFKTISVIPSIIGMVFSFREIFLSIDTDDSGNFKPFKVIMTHRLKALVIFGVGFTLAQFIESL